MSAPQSGSIPGAAHDADESVLSHTFAGGENDAAYSEQENAESRSRQLFHRRRGVFSKFIRLVSRLPRLREDAVHEQVLGRQKRRELDFKMTNVSKSYAKFMGEIQTLVAQGKLDGFPELLKLADECQEARDKLGPLEADCTEAEQEWEWKFSKLRLAEASAYDFYEANFDATEVSCSGPSSASSSQYRSSSDNNSQYLGDEFNDTQNDVRYQSIPSISSQHHSSLALASSPTTTGPSPEEDVSQTFVDPNQDGGKIDRQIHSSLRQNVESYYSNSVYSGAIDRVLENRPDPVFTIPEYPQQTKRATDIENYPRLLLDFTTVRERVTNWLLHSVLLSRWEARQLKDRLEAEDPNSPSNWAQLVLAWWEKDIAAAPDFGSNQKLYTTSHQKGPIMSEDRTSNPRPPSNSGQPRPYSLPDTLSNSDHLSALSGDYASRSTGHRSPGSSSQISATATIEFDNSFVALLFEHEDWKVLFRRVSESVEASIFIGAFRKLLASFSAALTIEAKCRMEIVASRFIHQSRRRISILVTKRVYSFNAGQAIVLADDSSDPDQETPMIQYLEQRVEAVPGISNVQKKIKNRLENYEGENEALTSLEHVRDFILKSQAFDEFRRNLEYILEEAPVETIKGVKGGSRQRPKSEGAIIIIPELDSDVLPQKDGDHEQAILAEVLQPTRDASLGTEVLESPSMTVAPTSCIAVTASSKDIKPSRVEVSAAMPLSSTVSMDCNELFPNDSGNATTVSVAPGIETNNHTPYAKSRLTSTKAYDPERLPTEATPIQSSEIWNPKDTQKQTEDFYSIPWSEQLWNDQRRSYNQAHENSKGRREVDENRPTSPPFIPKTEENVDNAPNQVQSIDRAEMAGSSQSPLELHPEPNSSISQTHVTRNSTRQDEKSDKNYKEHEKREFRRGRVFKVLWSEPTSSDGEGGTVISAREQDGEKSTAKVRRFVIIELKLEHCLCLAIMTYGSRGTTKPGVHPDDHAIIYTERPVLMDGETKMTKPAIKIKPYSPRHILEPASRINYAKVYTVEYDVKLWFIGEVQYDWQWKLEATYREMHPPLIFPSMLSSSSTTSHFPAEPPSPSVHPAQHDEFTPDTVSSAALSQSSRASDWQVAQQFSTGEQGGEGNRPWEAPKAKLYHGQIQYPAGYQDSPSQRLKNQFSLALVPKHDHVNDGK